MVEIKRYKMKKPIILLVLFLGISFSAEAQEVAARIPGLESNETYMGYLREDARLQVRIDSLTDEASSVRQRFRDDPENRSVHTSAILKIEERLFALRSEKGELVARINAIEQEWILKSMMEAPSEEIRRDSGELPDYSDAPRSRNLVENACFREELPPSDFVALRKAQWLEGSASACIERFADNYARLIQMQGEYAALTDQSQADETFDRMTEICEENRRLDDSLQGIWNYIFDNKSYAYSFLLDKYGRESRLERETERLTEAQRESEADRGRYASDALVNYFLQKRALVAFEQTVAREFALYEAQDSLAHEMDYLQSVEFRLPRVEPERRYLLDYEAVGFSSPSKYNARNPIPACKVYDRGTIYRIRLGRYKVKQAVNIFKGVYPLALFREADGRYGYYAGGYATLVEAHLACELLLKKGFRRPEIVRWTDGTLEEVSSDEISNGMFRVEISGVENLGEELRTVIRALAGDKELARVGSAYVVGSFADRSEAEQLARALVAADGSVSAEVKEISAE